MCAVYTRRIPGHGDRATNHTPPKQRGEGSAVYATDGTYWPTKNPAGLKMMAMNWHIGARCGWVLVANAA